MTFRKKTDLNYKLISNEVETNPFDRTTYRLFVCLSSDRYNMIINNVLDAFRSLLSLKVQKKKNSNLLILLISLVKVKFILL